MKSVVSGEWFVLRETRGLRSQLRANFVIWEISSRVVARGASPSQGLTQVITTAKDLFIKLVMLHLENLQVNSAVSGVRLPPRMTANALRYRIMDFFS
jgi:hypothetical protein